MNMNWSVFSVNLIVSYSPGEEISCFCDILPCLEKASTGQCPETVHLHTSDTVFLDPF